MPPLVSIVIPTYNEAADIRDTLDGAPTLAPLLASDDEFFRINALLLRNPAVVNLLDGCAITLPCHAAGEPPVGLMLWAPGGRDDLLLDAASTVEAALQPQRGA